MTPNISNIPSHNNLIPSSSLEKKDQSSHQEFNNLLNQEQEITKNALDTNNNLIKDAKKDLIAAASDQNLESIQGKPTINSATIFSPSITAGIIKEAEIIQENIGTTDEQTLTENLPEDLMLAVPQAVPTTEKSTNLTALNESALSEKKIYVKLPNETVYQSNLKAGVVFTEPLMNLAYENSFLPLANQINSADITREIKNSVQNTFTVGKASQLSDQVSVNRILVNKSQILKNLAAGTVFTPPIITKANLQPTIPILTSSIEPDKSKIDIAKYESTNNLPTVEVNEKIMAKENKKIVSENKGVTDKKDFSFLENEIGSLVKSESYQKSDNTSRANELKFAQSLDEAMPKLKELYANKENSFRIKLNPVDLGNLDFKLSKDNEKISAEILVDNKDLSDYLKKNSGNLKQILADSGIKLENLQIKHMLYADQDSGSNFASQQDDSQKQQNTAPNFNGAAGANKKDLSLEEAKSVNTSSEAENRTKGLIDLKV